MHRARIEKEEKLMKFQQEVKERVKVMARLKSKQQLEKSYRAVSACSYSTHTHGVRSKSPIPISPLAKRPMAMVET